MLTLPLTLLASIQKIPCNENPKAERCVLGEDGGTWGVDPVTKEPCTGQGVDQLTGEPCERGPEGWTATNLGNLMRCTGAQTSAEHKMESVKGRT